MALIVGNSVYQAQDIMPLPTVCNDVKLMESKLAELGFKVISLVNLEKQEMEVAIKEFCLLLDQGIYGKQNTVRCRYNAVNFHLNSQKRHPMARPWGRGMGCLFVTVTSYAYFTSVFVVPYAKSCYVELCYNGTRLYIDGLMQDCSKSISNALELQQDCTKPSTSTLGHGARLQ